MLLFSITFYLYNKDLIIIQDSILIDSHNILIIQYKKIIPTM